MLITQKWVNFVSGGKFGFSKVKSKLKHKAIRYSAHLLLPKHFSQTPQSNFCCGGTTGSSCLNEPVLPSQAVPISFFTWVERNSVG